MKSLCPRQGQIWAFKHSLQENQRRSFARLFKLTKHIALLLYLLSPYLLSCMKGSRNVRKNMHIIILRVLEHRLRYDEFRCRWDSNSVSQVCAALKRPVISKCKYSTKFGNTVCKLFTYSQISVGSQNKAFREY